MPATMTACPGCRPLLFGHAVQPYAAAGVPLGALAEAFEPVRLSDRCARGPKPPGGVLILCSSRACTVAPMSLPTEEPGVDCAGQRLAGSANRAAALQEHALARIERDLDWFNCAMAALVVGAVGTVLALRPGPPAVTPIGLGLVAVAIVWLARGSLRWVRRGRSRGSAHASSSCSEGVPTRRS